mmetsp:Transcript_6533/g.15756  ORF Transcript_6533/g.15756 Transcript_6533/m.15756 type:complete len:124 (-) Transcript_6533:25-396(-)|eukprot:CAMPEP_0173422556 /NCGR_PEP_ID=MMETSP1357-20121228/3219_1 /TAXON_ID=77926 /ORGANISM="Hemiselmis rufescens, Strain PCC563" /LENGTH=123 /DNA_ID=CAMNT_0014385597 /DNA_START=25 /DNA_END=396 /DNA_ORIENTATION=+
MTQGGGVGTAEAAENQPESNRNIAGIGIHFTPDNKGMHIITGMRPGGPAESCGRILVGDILFKVDQKEVRNVAIQDVIRLLTGPPDTAVTLAVLDGKFPYLAPKLCECQRVLVDQLGVITKRE